MMKYNIIITAPAESDITDTLNYIKQELKNPSASKELMYAIYKRINILREFPYSADLCNDIVLRSQGIHIAPINNYLIFYTVNEEKKSITVIRFLYARRDWITILKSNL